MRCNGVVRVIGLVLLFVRLCSMATCRLQGNTGHGV